MVWVYITDHAVDSTIKVEQSGMLLIGWLVEGVISGDPYIVAVSLWLVTLRDCLTLARCCHSTTARS
jgi:hypothetical protein